jgi:hypothetical protein
MSRYREALLKLISLFAAGLLIAFGLCAVSLLGGGVQKHSLSSLFLASGILGLLGIFVSIAGLVVIALLLVFTAERRRGGTHE